MLILGIECTAHTFGIGIADSEKKKILANERDMYKTKEGFGIIPIDAAKHHVEIAPKILNQALNTAGLQLADIDRVAVSTGPGLPPCLLAGLQFACGLNKPLAGVNHCVAHIEIGKLNKKLKDPLTVYVSGGNTQIIAYDAGRYRIFGETLDIGIGNAIDKFAREIGLEMPGGPKVEALASKSKNYIELPYTVKGMDLTYSGLVTAGARMAEKHKKEDICYSFQETAFAMIAEVAERALAHTEKKEVLLTGGVAQNARLQEMMKSMAKDHGAKFTVPDRALCGDNGAMIAWTGSLMDGPAKDINPCWRTDEVEVSWMK
ncbi:MAG: KEOPS complex N(6)-L-threonylcarbamoyladenine synthase Kae1 [Candidatus Micrarchaeota archaeon]